MTSSMPVSTKFYLAGRFSRRAEMRAVAADLEAAGHVVTSRWIRERAENEARAAANARRDLRDIDQADAVLVFTDEPRSTTSRGGHWVEVGYALGQGKAICVIGWRENVFCWLPEISFFPTWAEALDSLQARVSVAIAA
jgi:nucleoside 2-deoxyribosyltransferase